MTIIQGNSAETVVDVEPPPAPLRLGGTGRLAPSAQEWRTPLPPRLAARLPKSARAGHERLVVRWQQATVDARTAALEADKAHEADNQATRAAVAAGKRPPAATEPALRASADEAERVRAAHAQMVLENGTKLVAALTDADLAAVIAEASAEESAVVAQLPGVIGEALATLARAGEAAGEAAWISELAARRRQTPWTAGRRGFSTPALAQVREALERAAAVTQDELEERHRRANPPQHHAPTLAVPVDQWPEPERAA